MENKMFNELLNLNKDQTNLKELELISRINKKLKDMEKSQFRTTNFSIIQYLAKNRFKPLKQDDIINRLLEDYKQDPKKYILSNEKTNFKNINTFKSSILVSISKNKSFEKDSENGKIWLNLKNTCQYLQAMYRKYTSNSRDITTPNKINIFNQYKNKKKNIGMKSVLNVKHNIEDEENNLKKQNSKIRRSESKYFCNVEDFNDEINSFSIYDQTDNKNSFIKNINENNRMLKFNMQKNKNSNKSNLPEIFFEKLFHDNYIESLNNDGISFVLKEIENYKLIIKEKNINDSIELEIDKLSLNIKNFYSKKKEYDKHISEIKKFQKELLYYYKMMEKILKIIELETYHIMNYDYDTYINFHELALKRNDLYENVLEEIRTILDDIRKLKKELIDNKNSIIDSIFSIQSINGFNDSLFNKKVKFIEKELNLSYSPNQLELIENYDNLSKNEIVMRFTNAKKKIIDKINSIYDTMANITVP